MRKILIIVLAASLFLVACSNNESETEIQVETEENTLVEENDSEEVDDTPESEISTISKEEAEAEKEIENPEPAEETELEEQVTLEDLLNAEFTPKEHFIYTETEYMKESGVIAILDYIGPGGLVKIPGEIDGKPVKYVSNNSFYFNDNCYNDDCESKNYNKDKVQGVMFPDEVYEIGYHAFIDHPNLQVFVSGDGVEEIANFAFSGAEKLHTLILNEGLKSIGQQAFERTPNLNELELPSTLFDHTTEGWEKLGWIGIDSNEMDDWNKGDITFKVKTQKQYDDLTSSGFNVEMLSE